jgi:hypothetical protein
VASVAVAAVAPVLLTSVAVAVPVVQVVLLPLAPGVSLGVLVQTPAAGVAVAAALPTVQARAQIIPSVFVVGGQVSVASAAVPFAVAQTSRPRFSVPQPATVEYTLN